MKTEQQKNIYYIAEKAGVSIATVSKVLNHRRGVSAATAEKVNRVLREIDFTPRRNALKKRAIGLALPPFEGVFQSAYYSNLVGCIYEELIKHGYSLQLLCRTMSTLKNYGKGKLGSLEDLDGLISVANPPDYEMQKKLLQNSENFPCVVIGKLREHKSSAPGEQVNNIIVDDYTAGYRLAMLMLKNNHKSFHIVTCTPHDMGHEHRLSGILDALHHCNIPESAITVEKFVDHLFRRGNQLAMSVACSPKQPPEAFLFTNSHSCIGFVTGCQNMSLHIPDCFSVAGFEDDGELARLQIPITSVHISSTQLAANAVAMLLAIINRTPKPHLKPVEPTLEIRNSVKKR